MNRTKSYYGDMRLGHLLALHGEDARISAWEGELEVVWDSPETPEERKQRLAQAKAQRDRQAVQKAKADAEKYQEYLRLKQFYEESGAGMGHSQPRPIDE